MRPLLVAVLLIGTASARAVAQPDREQADRTAAQRLVKEGTALYDQGLFEGALERFQQAQTLVDSPKLHYNIALAMEGLKRPVEAADHYERFLQDAADAPAAARAHATRQLSGLDKRLARLRIQTDPAGASLVVDGKQSGPAPATIRVMPGARTIEASAAGRKSQTQTVNAVAGGTTELTVVLPAVDLTVHKGTPPPSVDVGATGGRPSQPLYKKWWVWGIAGAVVVATITTVAIVSADEGVPSGDLPDLTF